MRDAPFLHAKHLDEAVRRGVISSDQREALAALARTMLAEESKALPEMGWFRWVLAAATAGAVGLPGLAALDAVRRLSSSEVAAVGLVAVGVTAGGALTLRGRREHAMVQNVLAAGAASFAWLVGAGAGLAAFGLVPAAPPSAIDGPFVTADQYTDYNLPLWTLPGDLAVLLAAGALGALLRAPAVALPASLALAHAVVRVGTYLHVTRPYLAGANVAWDDAAQLPWWLGASLAVAFVARALDRRFPRGADPGFWAHLAAPAPALLGAVAYVGHLPPAAAAVAALLWCGLFALAFAWRRIAWAAWGALGLAAIPLVSMREGPSGLPPMVVWAPVCLGAFAAVALFWRRHVLATASPDDERSPWN